jgi:hypothetical protein
VEKARQAIYHYITCAKEQQPGLDF